MSEIYSDGTYINNNPSWHEEDSAWKAAQIIKIMERNGLTAQTICEIGCGAGEILNVIANKNLKKIFYGYEISSQAFELCSKKSKENLHFLFEDLLSANTEYFDIMMAIDVFEHIEDYYGFLRKIKEKAEYKIFHIPLDLSVQSVLRVSPIMKNRNLVGHIHYFTKETAIAALGDTEYEIIDFFYTAGSIELPNQGWKKRLMRLPRKIAFAINEELAVRILGGYSLLVLAK